MKTAGFMKDATDPQWANDPFIKGWVEWMKKYMPDANLSDSLNLAGYAYAQTLEQVLKQCGNDLTRENIMKQAASLKDYRNEALLPGSLINTSATDYRVIEYMKTARQRLRRSLGRAATPAELAKDLGMTIPALVDAETTVDTRPLLSLDAPLDDEDGALLDLVPTTVSPSTPDSAVASPSRRTSA